MRDYLGTAIVFTTVVALLIGLAWGYTPATAKQPAVWHGEIQKTMDIPYERASFTSNTFIEGDTGYMKIWSQLTAGDVINTWQNLEILKFRGIKKAKLFLNSPGGDAFSGMAISDLIKDAIKGGMEIEIYASGIVASAAVPIFVVGSKTVATSSTIFMVHEASLWKWPGKETHSNIKAQNRLLDKLQGLYLERMVEFTNLSLEEWLGLASKTSWFDVKEAFDWGLVDEIR